jgi:hypothetical protein
VLLPIVARGSAPSHRRLIGKRQTYATDAGRCH